MNESRSEYLGSTNGNGNGNGHGKIFDLAPKEDPLLARVVPAARRRVCENSKIPESARMFFCWLTDTSLTKGVYSRPGVVHFADSYLANRFHVSRKTIQNWRAAVVSTGEVWSTELRMKNSFPKTVYNITCILGQQMPLPIAGDGAEGDLPEDIIQTSNRLRLAVMKHERGTGKFACREHGVAGCPVCRARRGEYTPRAGAVPTPTPQKTEENEPSGKILPSTTAIDCRPPRQMVAVHHGNELPSPTANGCRGERQTVAVAHGNRLPLPTANGCRGERKEIADKRETGDVSLSVPEAPLKRSTGFNARNGHGGAKKLNVENLFLLDVGAMMERWKPGSSKAELENSGAWWRMSHRANSDLIQRVLNEINLMVVEGKIKTTPGQAAVDLWKRWSKDVLKAQLKQKAAERTAAR